MNKNDLGVEGGDYRMAVERVRTFQRVEILVTAATDSHACQMAVRAFKKMYPGEEYSSVCGSNRPGLRGIPFSAFLEEMYKTPDPFEDDGYDDEE